MSDSPLKDEVATPQKKGSNVSRWLLIGIPVALIGICCIAALIVAPSVFKLRLENGDYSIESVTLSTGLENGQPVGIREVFMPSDNIICTVKTSGVDGGIIGMRWYAGEQLIYENTGKTIDNTISTYIASNSSLVLPDGDYRVEIYMVDDPLETVHFEVRTYHPSANPPISIPDGHKNIEIPWYPEVPFAFDEVWEIGGSKWTINEVKIVIMKDTDEYFVAVVVDTDLEHIASMSEADAKKLASPVAQYAVENNYLEKARSLEIDGIKYKLDKFVFVNLINPVTKEVYRAKFRMDELR